MTVKFTLRRSWWAYLLQGLLTVIFGLVALLWPEITLISLVLAFGAFAVLAGLVQLAVCLQNRGGPGWWLVLLSAAAAVFAGIAAFAWPSLTALLLLYLIGAHALVAGGTGLWRTLRYWRTAQGRWWTLLSSSAAIVFGILAFTWPGGTALTLAWLVGIYALVFGASLVVFAFMLRGTEERR